MGRHLLRVTLFAVIIFAPVAALADKGCKNIQSRCAIEIGGRCNPVTGHWEYGFGRPYTPGKRPSGGNAAAFNACISRALAKKR